MEELIEKAKNFVLKHNKYNDLYEFHNNKHIFDMYDYLLSIKSKIQSYDVKEIAFNEMQLAVLFTYYGFQIKANEIANTVFSNYGILDFKEDTTNDINFYSVAYYKNATKLHALRGSVDIKIMHDIKFYFIFDKDIKNIVNNIALEKGTPYELEKTKLLESICFYSKLFKDKYKRNKAKIIERLN